MNTNDARRRSRRGAIILTASTVITLGALVFAFVQKANADVLMRLAEESHILALQEREQCLLEVRLLQEEISKRDSTITLLRAAKNQ